MRTIDESIVVLYVYAIYFETMSKENIKTIHEFDFSLICEYFSNVERQGPGSPQATIKALGFIDNLTPQSRIADIGCGTGGQTMTLAQNVSGQITGLDLFPEFINKFNRNAHTLGFSNRVKGIVGSMNSLPFEKEYFDLIWSEGAIYNIPNKVAQMQNAGYVPVATFILPENCWTEYYFAPCCKTQEAFLKKHAGSKTVEEFISGQRHEIELYHKYKEFYGYVFYIGKKI